MNAVFYDIKRTVDGKVDYYMMLDTWTQNIDDGYGYYTRKAAEENIRLIERSDRVNGRPTAIYEVVKTTEEL